MKLRCGKCRASAIAEDDIVYTPRKYRETEGIHRDKAKGIVCKPMPRSWHDRHTVNKIDDAESKELYRKIAADKKPYFMRYIYPALMKQYNTYIKNTTLNAMRRFQKTVGELFNTPENERTEDEQGFLYYYERKMPVGTSPCVMNKICRRFEESFDGHIRKHNSASAFDYTIMKGDAEYTSTQFYAVKKLYEEYNKRIQGYAVFANYERVDKEDSAAGMAILHEEFCRECEKICPNANTLCNIILDICYRRSSTKKFAWNMCGETIINNLLRKNNFVVAFPGRDSNGDFSYRGEMYSVQEKKIEVVE